MKALFIILLILIKNSSQSEFCRVDENESCKTNEEPHSLYRQKRYLLYDVNPGEGFNLRRDVYMRIATLVKKLNALEKFGDWTLVLPPWGPLYHWKTNHAGLQSQIKWSQFFEISSLKKYVEVMELEDYLIEHGPNIDVVYYLQHYKEGWTNGAWEEKADIRECIDYPKYEKVNDSYTGWFWNYDMFSKNFYCLSIQGHSSTLKKFLESSNVRALLIDRAEVILHDAFGDSEYWMVRRSMVFVKKLTDIGDEFRKMHLNSTDASDRTDKSSSLVLPVDRKALGGPYISVHLRRRDFVQARPKEVPSIENAAKQILKHMKRLKLQKLYVATDGLQSEFDEIQGYIPGATHFLPSAEIIQDILDGGVAIVDQWICAHARYFIGSYESTFSFRIQEEREILGFLADTTFNRLCGDNQTTCVQPSKWTIVFPLSS